MTRKNLFLLDPDIIFLNHGSFGATPRPVFAVYQEWQRRLEGQPVQFIINQLPDYFTRARGNLADYLHAAADDLVYIPNTTFGVNIVARSLSLKPGDEILTTDHEYGACSRTWQFIARQTGAAYIQQPIDMPVTSDDSIVEQFWRGVTSQTKVIYLSHITSPTALRLPVEVVCARAHAAGILTVIDGAHAPGQIPLHLPAIGADFYVGNCHKWLCSAKGSGFLYARPEVQNLIDPLVVGWGWGEERTFTFGSDFLDYLQWWGTKDPAAYLSTPAAIQFQAEQDWTAVRQQCHQLLQQALNRITDLTGLPPLYPDSTGFYYQMGTAPLPPIDDLTSLKTQLYEQYRIEVPLIQWRERPLLRISVQGYNSQSDIDALLTALTACL